MTVTMRKSRYFGLKQQAERNGRTVSGELDWILKNTGIPEIKGEQPVRQKSSGKGLFLKPAMEVKA